MTNSDDKTSATKTLTAVVSADETTVTLQNEGGTTKTRFSVGNLADAASVTLTINNSTDGYKLSGTWEVPGGKTGDFDVSDDGQQLTYEFTGPSGTAPERISFTVTAKSKRTGKVVHGDPTLVLRTKQDGVD